MKVLVHEDAPALASSTGFRVFLTLDLLLHLGLLVLATGWWFEGRWPETAWFAPACAGYALAALLTSLGSLGLRAAALVWRRRVAFLGVLGALLRGTPLDDVWLRAAIVLWGAAVWLATLLENRRISLAVVQTEAGHKAAASFK